jgi:hypothetical protein
MSHVSKSPGGCASTASAAPSGVTNLERFSPLDVHDASGLLLGLFQRARPNLSEADLKELAACDERARATVRHISSVCAGLGCLIASDRSSGALQSKDDLPDVLWLIGGAAEQALAMLDLAVIADQAGGAT